MGEVQSRTHAEGESESTFEAATRTISNPNRCNAVTYFAYQINKTQIVRFKILAITRRVIDPAGDSKVTLQPPRFAGEVSVIIAKAPCVLQFKVRKPIYQIDPLCIGAEDN